MTGNTRDSSGTADKTAGTSQVMPKPVSLQSIGLTPNSFQHNTATLSKTTWVSPVETMHGYFLSVPDLGDMGTIELVQSLSEKYRTEFGYGNAGSGLINSLDSPPSSIRHIVTLAKSGTGGLAIIRLGIANFQGNIRRLWIYGVIGNKGKSSRNPDTEKARDHIKEYLASRGKLKDEYPVRELAAKVIKISYVTTKHAAEVLKKLGFNVQDDYDSAAIIPGTSLPLVTTMPPPAVEATNLVGGDQKIERGGNLGVATIPQAASNLYQSTVATPVSELLVLYNPMYPEQYGQVLKALKKIVDRPARQIYVEGMVLEISRSDLEELGIDWQRQFGNQLWTVGGLVAGGSTKTFNFTRDTSVTNPSATLARIKALVRKGKAEILSRPSVLTLDGRQATIRVGTDVPISTAKDVGDTGRTFTFSFQYLPTGILLNIRPRISAEGKEVSMIIDTTVSAKVIGQDLEIRDTNNNLLASAPTVSTRRVQTYARIPNTTPLIIGGLVSRDLSSTRDRIPYFGRIPVLGNALGASNQQETKREVIIVLTPYVLADSHELVRSMPKDDAKFDVYNNRLFRDAYRIRVEDIFELDFFQKNKRLKLYSKRAQIAVEKDYRLAEVEPFSDFIGGRLPGEDILVHRMIYGVLKRLGAEKNIDPEKIIFFDKHTTNEYQVQFLHKVMSIKSLANEADKFFRDNKGKALAIIFHYDRYLMSAGKLATEPRPEIRMVNCKNRDEWTELMWKMNQPTADGKLRHTILIQEPGDLLRARRALLIKKVIELNGGEQHSTLNSFSLGRQLLLPKFSSNQYHLIDADVARYFFDSELYYRATVKKMEASMALMDRLYGKVVPE